MYGFLSLAPSPTHVDQVNKVQHSKFIFTSDDKKLTLSWSLPRPFWNLGGMTQDV